MMKHLFGYPRIGRRLIALIVSTSLMGVGVAIFDQLGFGTDPCSVFNLALSRKIGWSFGNLQLTMNCILLLILIALGELRRIGLGSLANMVLIGYVADFSTWLINMIHPLSGEPFLTRIIIFVPTMIMFLFVVCVYMTVGLGTAPYDALPMVIGDRQKKLPFSRVRMIWDITVLSMGFLLGGTVGLVTLITGFCLGPALGLLSKRIQPFFEA